ncbi:MAG: hypothetical protein EOO88_58670 [Pedobacter sp.]|nr:MAG: hypothetical protein EOO88_58670 [Pedobacter sp.]
MEGAYGGHQYYLRLEYTLIEDRKVLRQATTLVDGKLITVENPLFLEVKDDPIRTVEEYIDRLNANKKIRFFYPGQRFTFSYWRSTDLCTLIIGFTYFYL